MRIILKASARFRKYRKNIGEDDFAGNAAAGGVTGGA
jgi:hypothetical protein